MSFAYGFEQLHVIYKTPNYYEIEFSKDGILGIQQFPVEDVENFCHD